jgi:uncharacterized protein YbbC (DUF1343 family)
MVSALSFVRYRSDVLRVIWMLLVLAFSPTILAASPVKTGLDQLIESNFAVLHGKRVGLITNPTGVDRELRSTIDILAKAPTVELVALFGPEHGIRGDHSAGDKVKDAIDGPTGLPIYSLYGQQRKPTGEMLALIDVLVFDIQDIGVRSYTFIATLGLAMEAAAEHGKEIVVLDRPNPLGGLRMEGPLLEADRFASFVAPYPIPYVHGMTLGELARMINEEGWLAGGRRAKLTVVPMRGWRRAMRFADTKLPWVPTSPHVPHAHVAAFYAATGIIGELDPNMIGVGYTLPFEVIAAPGIDADKLVAAVTALRIPGLKLRPIHFKPYYMAGAGKLYRGVQLYIDDVPPPELTMLQFRVVAEMIRLFPDANPFTNQPARLDMFDKVVGGPSLRARFSANWSAADIAPLWQTPAPFVDRARRYHLYR